MSREEFGNGNLKERTKHARQEPDTDIVKNKSFLAISFISLTGYKADALGDGAPISEQNL